MKIPVASESRYSYNLQNLICISYTLFYIMELIEFETKTLKRTYFILHRTEKTK